MLLNAPVQRPSGAALQGSCIKGPLPWLGLWLVAVALHTQSSSTYGLGFVGGSGLTVCCKGIWFCCHALYLPKAGFPQLPF
ncbi:hypothetical protein U1Q18_021665 [Sarracenia purpurea var. burkii]